MLKCVKTMFFLAASVALYNFQEFLLPNTVDRVERRGHNALRKKNPILFTKKKSTYSASTQADRVGYRQLSAITL